VPGRLPVFDVDVDAARALAKAADVDAAGLLALYGIAYDDRPDGVEVVLGVHDDPSFGALVSFGVGGLATDLLGDRAYATVPLTDVDAAALVRAPKAFPLLCGYGGADPADLDALADVVLRLSALADDLPEIAECSLTARATPTGVHVQTAQIRVASPTARADTGPRRLPGL
jgi:hypothetical protein